MPTSLRSFLAFLSAVALTASPTFAFGSPLSDEAIREAYFLGQRHDGSLPRLLGKYVKQLPPPKTGPHISSISLLTPFVQLVQFSDMYIVNYSAQQASLDHRSEQETVLISITTFLTDSYGAYIAAASQRGEPHTYIRRPNDFWKGFQVEVSDGRETRAPTRFTGEPNLQCARRGLGCILVGATLHLEFPAAAFNSDSATIRVIPPEGPEVSVDFDLTNLR